MARIDKYEPNVGGFRAPLGFAPATADVGRITPVQINAVGAVIKSAAALCAAVICMDELLAEGDAVDCMTSGEIVDVVPALVSGSVYYAAAGGTYGTVATTATPIGQAIETWRLVVRVGKSV